MYEYKVVPAPKRGLKSKGVRGAEARFANALERIMNDHAQTGWEYQRTDTLPSEEREGLMGRATVYQNLLVFRRTLAQDAEQDVEAATDVQEETPLLEDLKDKPEPPTEPDVKIEEEIAEADVVENTDTQPQEDLADFKSERV